MDGLEAKLNRILSDPEALGSVLEMAKSIAGSDKSEKNESQDSPESHESAPFAGLGAIGDLFGGLDSDTLGMVMGLVGEYTRNDDRRTGLLNALKPYVSPERQHKMERAALIVKLARTARKALGNFGGGDDV